MSKKLNSEEIIKLFNAQFQSQIAMDNSIQNFASDLASEVVNGKIIMDVTIYGMCGVPPRSDFDNKKIKKCDTLILKDPYSDTSIKFKLNVKKNRFLNSNDYVICYEGDYIVK